MAEIKEVSYDSIGETLFIKFENYNMCLGTGDASEYEVLIDMELADQGEKKVVGIDILDMDSFDPEKVVGVPTEYIPLIKEVFTEYKRDMQT